MGGFEVYLRLTCLDDAESVKHKHCSGAPKIFEREMSEKDDSFPFDFCLQFCQHRKIEVVKPEDIRGPKVWGQVTLKAFEMIGNRAVQARSSLDITDRGATNPGMKDNSSTPTTPSEK